MSNAKPTFRDSSSVSREPARRPNRSPGPVLRPESPWKELIPIIGTTMKPSCQVARVARAPEAGAAATRGVGWVVIDGAHGAASQVSPEVFRLAGAEVVEIGTAPDGLNINDGYGSTHLDPLKAAVRAHGADLGIAHDGDADRCLAVDASGTEVDGDQIMGILAVALRERGQLAKDTLVATVMSNLGLLQAMEREGITVLQTAVGDRYVLEEMRAGGYSLGGEQSGHVILLDHGTTGDGVLTGLCSPRGSCRPAAASPTSARS